MSQLEEEQGECRENSEAPDPKQEQKKLSHSGPKGPQSPLDTEVLCRGLALPTRSGARASRCERGVSSNPGFWSWLECHLPIFSETRLSLSENSFTTDDLCKLLSGWDIYGCLMLERGAELHRLKSSLQVISLVCC